MIDTDKYEGHTEGPWSIKTNNTGHSVKDANGDHVCTIPDPMGMCNKHIIADAPLLLEEVKRLRDAMEQAIGYVVQDYYVLKVLCKALGSELQEVKRND